MEGKTCAVINFYYCLYFVYYYCYHYVNVAGTAVVDLVDIVVVAAVAEDHGIVIDHDVNDDVDVFVVVVVVDRY